MQERRPRRVDILCALFPPKFPNHPADWLYPVRPDLTHGHKLWWLPKSNNIIVLIKFFVCTDKHSLILNKSISCTIIPFPTDFFRLMGAASLIFISFTFLSPHMPILDNHVIHYAIRLFENQAGCAHPLIFRVKATSWSIILYAQILPGLPVSMTRNHYFDNGA